MRLFLTISLLTVLAIACNDPEASEVQPQNILFITIDDLRPQLGCYGDPIVKTPHIDRLADEGMLFRRAYCQQAICAPSRASFLTGRRPETTGVDNFQVHFRENLPDILTLPQFFKEQGYIAAALYKVFHVVGFAPTLFGNMDDTLSWSLPTWYPKRSAWGPEGDRIFQADLRQKSRLDIPIGYRNIPRSVAIEAPDIADSLLSDGETAQQALRYLEQFKDQPFFLAVGFYKPHLPFVAPKKYWELYDPEKLTLPDNQYPPEGAPSFAVANNRELRSYPNIPDEGPFEETLKKDLLHGYLASISYIDAQVGLLLEKLEQLGLREKTIVVLLGDHGYQVGEHGMWAKKHTNYETSVRVPLIVSAPERSVGSTNALVELVDLYPSLAELCGFTPPEGLEGHSFIPLLDQPQQVWKRAAFSNKDMGGYRGQSIRTDRFRLVEWTKEGKEPIYELYDHVEDPDENVNRADDPGYLKERVELIGILRAGWRAALPGPLDNRSDRSKRSER